MWNIFGTEMGYPEDENIRPWFYSLSLMSRYFPEGCKIMDVSESGMDGIRAVAGTMDGRLTIAVVNNSGTDRKISLTVDDDLGVSPERMTLYHFYENDRPADEDQLPVPAGKIDTDFAEGVDMEIPAKGFALLTSFEF